MRLYSVSHVLSSFAVIGNREDEDKRRANSSLENCGPSMLDPLLEVPSLSLGWMVASLQVYRTPRGGHEQGGIS